jgi:branched-chain amino acid transport system permease protein
MIALSIIAVLISYWVRTSKFGLGLLAIREDEDAVEVMDIVAPNAKTWAYVLSAIVPGLIGVLFFLKMPILNPMILFPCIPRLS